MTHEIYDRAFSEVSVDSGIEIGREPRIHFGRILARDASEEGSYGRMIHRPYSTSLLSVLTFEKYKNGMKGFQKYLGTIIDRNTLMRKRLKGNYELKRFDFTVIGAQNVSAIRTDEYEELLRMSKSCARDERFLNRPPELPSPQKLMETFCELTATPFEKTRNMCLGEMEKKLEKATGRFLRFPADWKCYDFY